MAIALENLVLSGQEVLPIIEGGKGIGVSNGESAGAFARANGIGTFSGVNATSYDENGKPEKVIYHEKTRLGRHRELIKMATEGGIDQAQRAHDISGGHGRIHMNILWEMGGAEEILHGILDATKGLIHGITCGAGMPYKLGAIAEQYKLYYYPIISSMRAFRALWLRSYVKFQGWLGGVVYEDPWLAGGHNGLSNSEDPKVPQDPYPRIVELRKFMRSVGLDSTPIIMAGGIWHIKEYEHWLHNPDIGPIAFQFGTRPIVTQESPVSETWKKKLLHLEKGEVLLNRFSPTGFYSSAIKNEFINELARRETQQISFSSQEEGDHTTALPVGPRKRLVYVSAEDYTKAQNWIKSGHDEALRTPDSTLIFVTQEKAQEIHKDQVDCMGCLSACRFSNWRDRDDYTTHNKTDPRSFCIQKTLQNIVNEGDIDHELMFSGHNAYRFAKDPFYKNGFIPSVQELVERIASGY